MKRILMLAFSALLVVGSATLAAPKDQDKTERPRRTTLPSSGYLGVEIEEVTSDVAGRLRLREERGAWITSVTGDTAAAKAGLQKDDVIVRWNGEPVESARALSRHIRETPAGRSVKLGVLRNGNEMEVAVTLGDRGDLLSRMSLGPAVPRVAAVARPAPVARVYVRPAYQLGISLQSLSPQLAEYFGLQNRSGALVTFVHPDSAAAKAGIKAGDVILSIGGQTIEHPARVSEALRDHGEGPLEVKVMRDRQERSLTVQLEKGKTSMVWPDDNDVDVVVSEALAAPIEIGPINIAPLKIAPIAIPQIHIEPVTIPQIRIAPITIPKMNMPKIVMPPIRIVIPEIVFRTEV
ncbi:MAG TPA: PDZ domain-containing protein [Blastocatellia bacterium]|nr:PDZ domain-containing protein [Blastocatellia bacterium]